MPPPVELKAKLNRTRENPDYDIFAAEQLVGRIRQLHQTTQAETWWWGLNTITFDSTLGAPMKGYAESLPKAQEAFRAAFDRWLEWARALSH